MGGKESKEEGSDPNGEKVFLNVYHNENNPSALGLGIYHSGILVYGGEITFAGGSTSTTGVYSHRPQNPGGDWKFKEQVYIGTTSLEKNQVRDLVTQMKREYPGNSYDVTSKNCNHFTNDLSQRLTGKPIPNWVNRVAKVGKVLQKIIPTQSEPQDDEIVVTHIHDNSVPPDGVDLLDLIKLDSVRCLNESKEHPVSHLFPTGKKKQKGERFLQSDADEQLLIHIPFIQPVKLQSMSITSFHASAPKVIKFYLEKPSINFDDVEDIPAQHTVTLANQQERVSFPLSKFHNVQHLTVFVESNLDGSDTTFISSLQFFGMPHAGKSGPLQAVQ